MGHNSKQIDFLVKYTIKYTDCYKFKHLSIPYMCNEKFGRKRCKKKRKDVYYQLIKEFFQK